MQRLAWILRGSALLLALVVVTAATANERVAKARDLFQKQDYVAAQAALKEVDRDDLDKGERAEFDRLQRELPRAVAGNKQAHEDMFAASKAYSEGRWDDADTRFRAVLDNAYATTELRTKATIRRKQVEEKRNLADAAAPEGVIDLTPRAGKPATAEPIYLTPVAQAPAAQGVVAEKPAPGPRRVTPIDEMRNRDNLLWQRAVAQSEGLATQAREAVAEEDFRLARQLAELALQKIEAARSYAEPVAKYLTAKEAAERLKKEVSEAYESWLTLQAGRERDEIAERVAKRSELLEQHRREKVEQLFNTAAQLRAQQRFSEAAEVLRQILYIDPANAKARDQLEIAEDYASLLAQQGWQDDLDRQFRDAIINAQEALIPWDYEVLYPKNWLELTAKRSQAGVGIGGSQEDSELNRRLDEVLPEFEFEDAPLGTVMEHLQDVQDINIAVDWEDLSNSGIEADKPVSMALRGLPFRTVLKEVLTQVGGEVPLSYSVAEGLLRVATKDKLDRSKYVLVYDVRDLLIDVARFTNAARMDPAQGQRWTTAAPSGTSQLFDSPGDSSRGESEGAGDRDGMVGQVMSIIRQTVAPDSWQETGGSDASIRELNGQLIVYNTSDAHAQVRGLLDQLRARRALQIALEARFLDVTSNFLEEFGVDLDFVFNSASAGYDQGFAGAAPLVDPFSGSPILIPRVFSQLGSLPATPGLGIPLAAGGGVSQPYTQAGLVPSTTGIGPSIGTMTPISAQQSSLSLTDPVSYSTRVPGSFAQRASLDPALSIAGSFLDNLQVDFLIRATQANGRSAVVQAPRIVMENWSQTFIQVGATREYIASINPTVAEGAALAQPVPAQAQSGTVLGVFGTISADRRYVAVRVQANQFDAPTFERFEVTRAAGNSPGVFVQLRSQSFVTLNTQVSIPDGGTVLLGGLKQVGEVEVEAGVPILSKIPVMKRFFTNRTSIKDTRTLLVLMKAKIIIQNEAEEEAFPTFGSLGRG